MMNVKTNLNYAATSNHRETGFIVPKPKTSQRKKDYDVLYAQKISD